MHLLCISCEGVVLAMQNKRDYLVPCKADYGTNLCDKCGKQLTREKEVFTRHTLVPIRLSPIILNTRLSGRRPLNLWR
jgi:hypothetical protein